MALHLTEWQHRLMPPFLVAFLPLFCFWFIFGMWGEINTIGVIMTSIYILIGTVLIKTSEVKESEENEELDQTEPSGFALFLDNELAQWISGWFITAVVIGLVTLRSDESSLSNTTIWLVFTGHVLWTTIIFWAFYKRSRRQSYTEPT